MFIMIMDSLSSKAASTLNSFIAWIYFDPWTSFREPTIDLFAPLHRSPSVFPSFYINMWFLLFERVFTLFCRNASRGDQYSRFFAFRFGDNLISAGSWE